MQELIGDYTAFLDKLMDSLKEAKVDVSSFFMDHICYRVDSQAAYEEMKERLKPYGKLLTEEEVNGRPIASYKLHKPLVYKSRQIPLLELPAPKKNSTHPRGLEHAEFVINLGFQEFMDKHPHLTFVTKGLAKEFNPELEIEFTPTLAVKFHHMPLESVIAVEQQKIPKEFCNLRTHVPFLLYRADYFGTENFTRSKVKGYDEPIPVMTRAAADKLKSAAKELEQHGLGFMVFDSYRPQMAVDFFQEWAKADGPDFDSTYFPDVKRKDLFDAGYLAKKSSHSRGSTIDLTLYQFSNKKELDMGTIFDYFHESSHTFHPHLSDEVKERRKFFVELMARHGFRNYSKEWWHFTMIGEPYPTIYFNFPIREFWNE